jgi:TPR repeat protein
MLYLSRCYQYGIGIDVDQAKATKWHDRAALFNSVAQFEKGMNYYDGTNGKEVDESKALEWFLAAATQGHIRAIFFAGCICRDRKDFNNARKYFQIGAEKGDLASINNYGYMYQHATGVEESLEDALFWYQIGVERNYPPAMHNLATMYQIGMYKIGTGLDQSDVNAISLFTKAALMGYDPSQHHLARCYQSGICVDRDISQAIFWYEKSIEYPQSQNSLGFLYEKGFGVERDDVKAEKYYLMAAEQGDVCAQYNFGDFYEKRGDVEQAQVYFSMAKGQGDCLAEEILSLIL